MRAPFACPALLAALVLAATSCGFPVEGRFAGSSVADRGDPARTIVLIYNHGFSREWAGTYQALVPPILKMALEQNSDVVLFSQVRNTSRLGRTQHGDYIEAAVEQFRRRDGVPLENIILVGQSCGGWGSLQAAAFTYPAVGGVVAFAPTCHGQLPHATEVAITRRAEIDQLADRARFPAIIFLYENDSYYRLADWDGFEARAGARASDLRIERLSRAQVLDVCPRCSRDSHGAMWEARFAEAFYASHLQPLIERVRARIRVRAGTVG